MCVNMNVNGYSYSTYLIPTTEMTDAKFNVHLRKGIYVPALVFDTLSLGSETRQDCIGEVFVVVIRLCSEGVTG